MTGRADEIVEAVLFLHDLGKPVEFIRTGRIPTRQKTLFGDSNELQKQTDLAKPVEFIANQLGLNAAEVVTIIKTGRIPARQQTLFSDSNEPQKQKPVSRLAPWKQALRK